MHPDAWDGLGHSSSREPAFCGYPRFQLPLRIVWYHPVLVGHKPMPPITQIFETRNILLENHQSQFRRFEKTSFRVQGRIIYCELATGRYWYVDNLHFGEAAHLEVFDKTGNKVIYPRFYLQVDRVVCLKVAIRPRCGKTVIKELYLLLGKLPLFDKTGIQALCPRTNTQPLFRETVTWLLTLWVVILHHNRQVDKVVHNKEVARGKVLITNSKVKVRVKAIVARKA